MRRNSRSRIFAATILIAAFAIIGCGATFQAKKSAWVNIKPIAPSAAVVLVDGDVACRVDNPTGPMPIEVVCAQGQVQWFTDDRRATTCIPDPCGAGKHLRFDPAGRIFCDGDH